MGSKSVYQIPALQALTGGLGEEDIPTVQIDANAPWPMVTRGNDEAGQCHQTRRLLNSLPRDANLNARKGALYVFDYVNSPLIHPAKEWSQSPQQEQEGCQPFCVYSNSSQGHRAQDSSSTLDGAGLNGQTSETMALCSSEGNDSEAVALTTPVCQPSSLGAELYTAEVMDNPLNMSMGVIEQPPWLADTGALDEGFVWNVGKGDSVHNDTALLCEETWESFQHEILSHAFSDRRYSAFSAQHSTTRQREQDKGIKIQAAHKAPFAVKFSARPKRLLQSSLKAHETNGLCKGGSEAGRRRGAGIYLQGALLRGADMEMECGGGSNQPSRFCHICLRRAERVALMACSRLRSGLCRKVVCEKCFEEFGYDWEAAALPRSGWTCTHCRQVYVLLRFVTTFFSFCFITD